MKEYVCDICGFSFKPQLGDEESGIEPGTLFENIPDGWECPICGCGKEFLFEVED